VPERLWRPSEESPAPTGGPDAWAWDYNPYPGVASFDFQLLKLGNPKWLALSIDWTMFQAPGGQYQVLCIAIPRRGRGIPLVHLAYEQRNLPKSQNHLEEEALWAVIGAYLLGCAQWCWPTAALLGRSSLSTLCSVGWPMASG
jgi:hypothetical protein